MSFSFVATINLSTFNPIFFNLGAIIERPLPEDPKLAMAEVQRRRLETDQKDKYVRQLAPLGVRNKAEDNDTKVSGTITLKWDDSAATS